MKRFACAGVFPLAMALAMGMGGTVWGQATSEATATATATVAPAPAPVQVAPKPHDFARWEAAVAAFEKADRENPPAKGGVLFVGSSTIVRWKTLAEDFPEYPVLNRGFGGNQIVDSTHYADRIIFPYEPKQIILRAGGNDIAAGKLPKEVAADFKEFVRVVRERLPNTEIVYLTFCATPRRWGDNDKLRDLNRRIRRMALNMPRVCVADTFDMSLDENGRARPEMFVADMLHLSDEGYKVLAERLRPYLLLTAKKPAKPAVAQ